MPKYVGFAGTYTRESSKGIYQFTLDTEAGVISKALVAAEVGSPTYLTMTADNRHLFAVAKAGDLGGFYAYDIDENTYALSKTGEKMTPGAPPCYISVHGDRLLTANYHEGNVGMFQMNHLENDYPETFVKHDGKGPHQRQEKPHLHYADVSPDGKFIFACDLGTDELVTYEVNGGSLKRVATLNVAAGSGPRHLAFHPNGAYAFLITELSSEVLVLKYEAETGSFTVEQTIKTIPNDFKETNDASAIKVSRDGRFVYAGNRGHNSIAVFEVNKETMALSLVQRIASGGDWPRDFTLDPSEEYLLASHQHSGNIVLFKRDKNSGALSQTESEIAVPEVVCVKFLHTK